MFFKLNEQQKEEEREEREEFYDEVVENHLAQLFSGEPF